MYSLCPNLLLCFLPFFGLGKHNTHTASFLFNNSKCFLSNKISIFPRFPILVFISCNLTFGYTICLSWKNCIFFSWKNIFLLIFFVNLQKFAVGLKKKTLYIIISYSCTFTPWSLYLAKKPISPTIRFKNSTFSNFLQQLRK